ncbi:hypothetical protein [Alkaliphilus sp. B6464]|uniref:hypothetical protein n=1 Tax=Alkaliphilus sp. B6464 TaxID=2731219 RepID=UPI001BA7FB51|nr:hypothetical protein [Alkaliphilus sp. B6464]QUH21802.1 hypothetical protein HYG84_17860 [Alkaliphilus sp. B6464]
MFERFRDVKVRIVDKNFIKKIPLEKVENFLINNGWIVEQYIEINSVIKGKMWTKKEYDHVITLPIKQNFLDYPIRLQETLDILMEVEEKNQLVLVEEIYNS